MNCFTYKIDKRGVATLTFDTPKSDANILSTASMNELGKVLDTLTKKKEKIDVLLIEGAKESIFIAGADINEIKAANNAKEINTFVKKGQDLFTKLENLPFPTLVVIDGVCAGGGLELALACDYRLASSSAHTKLGLPEVSLGIIPGFGGTQRLYKLVGYAKAMELIVGAKLLKAEKAFKLGLVDACVPREYLNFKKEEFIDAILHKTLDKKVSLYRKGIRWYEKISFVRDIIASLAKKAVLKKTAGHYPAPLKAIEVMQKTFLAPLEYGLEVEREYEVDLVLSDVSKNLIELFLISQELKHDYFSKTQPKEIKHAAVVGAGVMGSGIAWAMNHKDIDIRLKTLSYDEATKAISLIRKIYDGIIKRKRLTPREVDLKMDKITYTTENKGFENIDFLIEAVNESEKIKIMVYKTFEERIDTHAIIASNTSSISINQLAGHLQYPKRFIGMHFFNPVNRMPLVEIIPGEHTDDKTIATAVNLAKRLGKTPIKIKDSAGFLVNRILLPYLQEACFIFEDGGDIEKIDKTLLEFGMPMGAFTLIDTVGVDIGASVSQILHDAYGERMAPSTLMNTMVQKNLLGVKTKKGFYDYATRHMCVNQEVLSLQTKTSSFKSELILNRTMLLMINEASRCLEEGIVDNARYLDMAMVLGTGFPAFRGGLLRYADTLGATNIVTNLQELEKLYGKRFTPSELLKNMADNENTFYEDVK